MMKKKLLIIGMFFLINAILISNINLNKNFQRKVVNYNGNNLKVSIDGVESETLPTSGSYYLVSYTCKSKDTVIEWDRENYQLNVSNNKKRSGVSCYLEFETNPLLSKMPVGSYVDYTGVGGTVGSTSVACQKNGVVSSSIATAETESPNSCRGQNAREDLEKTNNGVYGYCYDAKYKFYTTGWRIAYISDSKAKIISAGSPECNNRVESNDNITYIKTANANALKYCNSDYVDGDCTCTSITNGKCDSASSDAWAINDTDFYNITKTISGYGKRLTAGSSTLGSSGGSLGGIFYCSSVDGNGDSDAKRSYLECGYNNDIIDNGGYYWFSAKYNSSNNFGVYWSPSYRAVSYLNTYAYGLRPIINLSSSVVVTGGDGTMESPYTIGNNTFWINDGATEINASDSAEITLELMGVNASEMCISTDTSVCTNYVDFATSYTLNWSTEEAGEKLVYVYYKNSEGNIIATMNKTVTLLAS